MKMSTTIKHHTRIYHEGRLVESTECRTSELSHTRSPLKIKGTNTRLGDLFYGGDVKDGGGRYVAVAKMVAFSGDGSSGL
ncbi:hypothetical protein Tco_1249501, partial [Tanacetum coccineum]